MATDSIYQLKITLNGSKPPIWRRVLVSNKTTLAQLHRIIQAAMGWYDSHLHHFQIGSKYYAPREFELDDSSDSSKVKLEKVAPTEKSKFIYEYDFGDSWEHTILVEKILPADPAVKLPTCTAGKRACPPEDVGGIWGYQGNFLPAIQDENDPEHETYAEWVGDDFDPEAFDLAAVNEMLHKMSK